MDQLATDFLSCCEMPLMRQHRRSAWRICRLSSVDWILSAIMAQRSMMRQRCNNLLIRRPVPTCACRRKLAVLTESSFFLNFYIGDAGNTPLGRDHSRYSKECRLCTMTVLHPGVPVMWHSHIRNLSPTAEAVRGALYQGNELLVGL